MRAIHVIFLIFSASVLLPQLYFLLNTPADHVYTGFFISYPDLLSYKMWMVQYQHTFFAQNLYSMSGAPLRYFNPYLYLESIPVNLGVDYWIVESIFKIIIFGIYLIILEKLVKLFLPEEDSMIAIILIVFFSSYFTIVMYVGVFLLGFLYSLSALDLLLQTVIIYLALTTDSLNKAAVFFFACILLFLSHPYSLIYLAPILAVYLALNLRLKYTRILFALLIISALVAGVFYLWEINGSPQYSSWAVYRFKMDSPLAFMFLFHLPFSITFLFGFFGKSAGKNGNSRMMLIIWILIVAILLVITPLGSGFPLPLQPPKFVIGLVTPLVILSFLDEKVASLLRRFWRPLAIFFVFLLLLFFIFYVSVIPDYSYYSRIDTLRAFSEVKNDPAITSTLSSSVNSLLAPFYTGKYSVPGHWALAQNYSYFDNLSKSILISGDINAASTYCRDNPDSAIITESQDSFYNELNTTFYPGVTFYGNTALVRCSEFGA